MLEAKANDSAVEQFNAGYEKAKQVVQPAVSTLKGHDAKKLPGLIPQIKTGVGALVKGVGEGAGGLVGGVGQGAGEAVRGTGEAVRGVGHAVKRVAFLGEDDEAEDGQLNWGGGYRMENSPQVAPSIYGDETEDPTQSAAPGVAGVGVEDAEAAGLEKNQEGPHLQHKVVVTQHAGKKGAGRVVSSHSEREEAAAKTKRLNQMATPYSKNAYRTASDSAFQQAADAALGQPVRINARPTNDASPLTPATPEKSATPNANAPTWHDHIKCPQHQRFDPNCDDCHSKMEDAEAEEFPHKVNCPANNGDACRCGATNAAIQNRNSKTNPKVVGQQAEDLRHPGKEGVYSQHVRGGQVVAQQHDAKLPKSMPPAERTKSAKKIKMARELGGKASAHEQHAVEQYNRDVPVGPITKIR